MTSVVKRTLPALSIGRAGEERLSWRVINPPGAINWTSPPSRLANRRSYGLRR